MKLLHRSTLMIAAICSLALSATTSAAQAAASQSEVDTVSVAGEDSSLTVTLDSPVTPEEADKMRETLEEGLEADKASPMAAARATKYRVISCMTSDTVIKDKSGAFNVRYNCSHNNVNWGYRVKPTLVAIAVGNMKETGAAWYKGMVKIGQNSPHNVPVGYFLHGTQGGVANGDTLSWHDAMTFRVNVGGKPGTAKLTIGGTFVVLRY